MLDELGLGEHLSYVVLIKHLKQQFLKVKSAKTYATIHACRLLILFVLS